GECFRQILDLYRTAVGPNHPAVAGALCDLASLSLITGRRTEAEAHYHEALAIVKKAFGEQSSDYANGLRVLSDFYRSASDWRSAEPLMRQRLEVTRRLCSENH